MHNHDVNDDDDDDDGTMPLIGMVQMVPHAFVVPCALSSEHLSSFIVQGKFASIPIVSFTLASVTIKSLVTSILDLRNGIVQMLVMPFGCSIV